MITGIILGVLVFGFIIYKVSKNKRQSQKTSTESIVGTIGNSISRMWSSTAKDLRTGEVVKAELLDKIDTMLINSRDQFRTYLIQLETGASAIEVSKVRTAKSIAKFRKEALDSKAAYEKSGEELEKTKAMQYLKHLKNAEATQITLEIRAKEIEEKLKFAEFEHENLIATLENKKVEVISEINPAMNLRQSQFSIAELEKEFDQKVQEQGISNKVDERISGMDDSSTVSDIDLESAFADLK